MTTPVFITGFEHGLTTFTVNGSGLFNTIVGSPTIDSSVKHSGNYSGKFASSGSACDVEKNISGSPTYMVARAYIRLGSLPLIDWFCCLAGIVNGGAAFTITYDPLTQNLFAGWNGSLTNAMSGVTLAADKWYCIDFRGYVGGTTYTLDWIVNGVTQTQYSTSGTATYFTAFGTGCFQNITVTVYVDDIIVSTTSGDYPIGEGATVRVYPSADGTHNNAENIIEDHNSVQIDGQIAVAYANLNAAPPNANQYVKHDGAGSSNYVEVEFSETLPTYSAILGGMAYLCYTSSGTSTNNGACMVSYNSFSPYTTVWGDPTTREDYSDGSTSNLYYKSAAISMSSVDHVTNLQARLGYSSDATPDPYWIELWTEIAVKIPFTVNVQDAIGAITESVTVSIVADEGTKTVNVSDAVGSITDTPTASVSSSQVTASETVGAITDTPTVQVSSQVNVSDTISAITDTPTAVVSVTISKTEAVGAISDTPSAAVSAPQISKTETISAITDTPTTSVSVSISKIDAIGTITDVPSAVVSAPQIAKVETLGVITDTPAVILPNALVINVSDTISSITDTPVCQIVLIVSKTETLGAITDSPNASVSVTVAASDATGSISDAPSVAPITLAQSVSDTVGAITDTPTVSIEGAFTISKSESVGTVTDTPTVQIPDALGVSVVDAVGSITDTPTCFVISYITKTETLGSITDVPSGYILVAATVSDAVGSVNDVPSVSLESLALSVSDAVGAIVDTPTVSMEGAFAIVASETLGSIADTPSLVLSSPQVVATDLVGAITDAPNVYLVPLGEIAISVGDAIGSLDTCAVLLPDALNVSTTYVIGVTDIPTVYTEVAPPTLGIAITPDSVFAIGVRIYP